MTSICHQLLLLCTAFTTALAYRQSVMTRGEVWPLPQEIEYMNTTRILGSDVLRIVFEGLDERQCDVLRHLKQKYAGPSERAFDNQGHELTVVIQVDQCPGKDEFPQAEMNEEYFLETPVEGKITLKAREVWGAIRGMETFGQLEYFENGTVFLRSAVVHDWPQYSHRGTLIDTSRHFLPKSVILRHIELMAMNKLNVLHWHIVDDPSFPYVSEKFPNLAKTSAYSPLHTYNKTDIQEIIEYARLRGIRVLPEFDTPGHVGSWSGQPGFLTERFDQGRPLNTTANILDPTKEENYDFLKELLDEAMDTFRDNYIHLGGDEAWANDWTANPNIAEYMKEHGIAPNDTDKMIGIYYKRLQGIVKELQARKRGRGRYIFWQEVFDSNSAAPEAIVQIWYSRNQKAMDADVEKVARTGRQILVSALWYLDSPDVTGEDWKEFYTADPLGFNGTAEQKKLVLGGEAALWGEYVDATNFESRMWPRASAFAERFWSSPKDTSDPIAAWPRLYEHRCRMVAGGYRAEPVHHPDANAVEFCPTELDTR